MRRPYGIVQTQRLRRTYIGDVMFDIPDNQYPVYVIRHNDGSIQ